ncbi:butyrophilin, subfamily 1, member A1, isoform CRA_b, partial [Rattus norvegicus]
MAVPTNSCPLVCLLTFTVLQLPTLDSAAPFNVTAPQESVLAVVGSDAELTCRFSPNASSEQMELLWFRQTRSPAVLLYRAGQEQEGEQMTEYHGRATLVTARLLDGLATLRIRGVRVSDQGQYRCFLKDNDDSEEAAVHLKVAAPFLPRLTPWIVALAIVILALGFLAIGSIFFTWKLYKERSRERKKEFGSKERLLEELRCKKTALHE